MSTGAANNPRSPDASMKLTPAMRQYDDAKKEYPDAIVFFRMGDFYEMFFEDAVLVSRLLGLTLTSRDKGVVPMAGVPHKAAHGYVMKLLALGHKVAICEQMADPSKVKGIVPRQVVRVVTPGLVTDLEHLESRENHYLVAAHVARDGESGAEGDPKVEAFNQGIGLARLDLSTGEVSATVVPDLATLIAELAGADPREMLVPAGATDLVAAARAVLSNTVFRDDGAVTAEDAARILDHVAEEPLWEAARAEHAPLAVLAAARVLRFAAACTPGSKLPVRRVIAYDPSGTLRIDETAQTHLEILRAAAGGKKGSLIDVMDNTVTPAGARLFRKRILAPLYDVAAIRRRLDAVELFVMHARVREELREALAKVGDLERLTTRALMREATPRDLGGIRDGLFAAVVAVSAARAIPPPTDAPTGTDLLQTDVDVVGDVAQELARALVDNPPPITREGRMIRDGADNALDEQRRIQHHGAEEVTALEAALRKSLDLPKLRVSYTGTFGWYIEVTKSQLGKVPPDFRRKQTTTGGERYTNDALDDLADRIEHAAERALERELEIFEGLVALVVRHAERIRTLAARLAEWDVSSALADVAHRYDYCRPDVTWSERIAIEDGRHPVVERFAAAGRFVPNATLLDTGKERLWLVTGPNMAGKSTLMRQVALIVLLAQMGSYVPARSAEIGVVDRILSRVGASDNVARGESTFMVEMRETAEILRKATPRSLVILDEIGRGTSTYDGLAIAWAVAEHLDETVRARAMFATHYHEITDLAVKRPRVANYSVSAREHGDDIVFLHKLQKGPASRSYGVAVARLAGLPEPVLARAKSLLQLLESGGPLPSGKPSSLRAKKGTENQLDLFGAPSGRPPPMPPGAMQAVELLKTVEIDRLTPLEALQLLAKVRGMIGA